MDLRVHRNDEPYWIEKQNITSLGVREDINPYMKSENIAPGWFPVISLCPNLVRLVFLNEGGAKIMKEDGADVVEELNGVEPVRMDVEVDHSLFGNARGNPQYANATFPTGTKRKTRTKCNCVECNPDFTGNPNPTPNVFQCNICQKCFTKCKYFRRHVGLHGKTKTLKCDLCQVSFMFSYQLQSHRLTHTHGQKPFQCNICRKSFTSKYYLKQHEWVHNPITPFKCRVCGKGYSSEGYFKRHEMSHAQ